MYRIVMEQSGSPHSKTSPYSYVICVADVPMDINCLWYYYLLTSLNVGHDERFETFVDLIPFLIILTYMVPRLVSSHWT
jgi:hypothetical protein